MENKVVLLAAMLLGCAAGFLGGRLGGAPTATPPGADPADPAAITHLEARVAELEAALSATNLSAAGEALPNDLADATMRALAQPRGSTADILLCAVLIPTFGVARPPSRHLHAPGEPALAALRTQALRGSTAEALEARLIEGARAGVRAYIETWLESYGVPQDGFAAIVARALEGFDALVAGRARGDDAQALHTIDQACQAHMRNYVGDEVYSEIVKRRLATEQTWWMAHLHSAQLITSDQAAAIKEVFETAAQRDLADRIRLRTDVLDLEERAQLIEDLDARWSEDKARIENEILAR